MKLIRASQIVEKRLYWLWPGLIPLGQTTLLEGDPGTAKSTLTLALASHVSRGADWPDGTPCPKGISIIANAEDPEEEIIVPRLRAAGADLDQCRILVPEEEGPLGNSFQIPDSISALESFLVQHEWPVKLLIFDPLEAFLSGRVDNRNNQQIRRALWPLEQLAKRLTLTVVLVRHLTKSTDKAAIYRGSGSIGIIGAARAALSVGRDKANKDRCIVVPVKQNWTKVRGGVAYKPQELRYVAASGEEITTSFIEWDGEVDVSADDVITAEADPSEQGTVEEAAQFLREALDGSPRQSVELFKMARQVGISRKTIWRASRLMSINKRKIGFGAGASWEWELRDEAHDAALQSWAGMFDIRELQIGQDEQHN